MADQIDFRVKNGLAVTTTATIESSLQATSTNTGALTVSGGAGVGGNLYVGGIFSATGVVTAANNLDVAGDVRILSETESTDSSNGSLTLGGGIGIGKNLNVAGVVVIENQTDATSTSSGALQVQGGLGVAGDVWIGGTLYGSILGSISTATNLAQGTAGQIPYQASFGETNFFGPGTAGDLIISGGTAGPSFVGTSTVYVGYAATSTNLNAGTTGSLPYQTAEGVTGFLSVGTAAQILTVNAGATAPQWSNTTSVTVGVATTATNADNAKVANDVASTTPQYVAFISTTTGYTSVKGAATSGLVYIPSSGNLGVGKVPTATLDVSGTASISGIATITNTTDADSTNTGAVVVYGGVGIGKDLYVGNTATILSEAFSTSTLGGNALHVAGGVSIGKSLYVRGQVLFQDNVTFAGTTTNIFSTNTVYTDNFIDLHFPSEAGPGGVWETDDGFDIGHIYHHYKDDTGDEHGALIWHNASDELRWYMGNVEYVGGTQVYNFDTSTYGVFRTGEVHLESTTTSVSTDTGALTVAGGVGIGGDLRVAGIIYGVAEVSGTITTATNLLAGTAGQVPYQTGPGVTSFFGPGIDGQLLKSNGATAPTYVDTSTVYVGYSVTATNINAGTAGQLIYQSDVGSTAFAGPGTAGQILVSNGTSGPVYTNTGSIYVGFAADADQIKLSNDVASSTPQYITFVSTTTGYVDLKASALSGITYVPSITSLGINQTLPRATLDVNGSLFVSGISTVTNITNATNTATGALQIRGGAAVGLDLRVGGSTFVGGNETITGDLTVNGGDITSGAATFNLLNATVTTLNVAGAGTAVTIGATTGYTDIRNELRVTETTDSSSTSTGALIVSGGAAIKKDLRVGGTVYGLFAGAFTGVATTSTNLAGGTTGQIPYQTAPGVTSFHGPGTAGQILVSNGTIGPQYTNTSSIYVGYAVTATHLAGGAPGGISYQTAAGRSSFLAIGSNGFVLTSNGTTPSWASVTGLTAGQADKIRTITTAGSAVNYITFVDSNNASTDYEDVFTTSSFVIRPQSGFVGLGTASPTTNFDLAGAARITGITTVTNVTNATNTSTGALQVTGGAAVGLDLRVGGSSFIGGSETITGDLAVNGGDITSSAASFNLLNTGVTTANVLGAGAAITIGAVTGFTNIRNLTTLTNTTISTNTTTGALRVAGGIGVGDSVYVKNKVGFVNASNVSKVYQYYNVATDSLDTVFE